MHRDFYKTQLWGQQSWVRYGEYLPYEVGGKSGGETAYGAVSFSRPRANFSRNWVDSNVWYRA